MNETNDNTMRESRFPEVWPGWETVEELGKGSFGAVYKVRRQTLSYEEYAAVKCISIPRNASEIADLRKSGYDDESITDNFREQGQKILREYSLMRSLNGHTNIVNCDDVRTVNHNDGFGMDLYIKMELLTPLEDRNKSEFTEDEIIKLGIDLLTALELCEKNGVIHRDIKPANIFVSKNGEYKLGDFGVSRIMEGTTTDGTVTGTPRYMAPEVYGNRSYNRTADIYSLGLVLYWLLNERRTPFQPLPPEKLSYSGDQDALSRRMKGEAIPEPKNGSEVLKKIVLKACAYDPKERYQRAAEMKRALTLMESPEPKLTEGTVSVRKTGNASEPMGTVSVRKTGNASEPEQGAVSAGKTEPKKPKKWWWLLALIPLLLLGAYFALRDKDKPEDEPAEKGTPEAVYEAESSEDAFLEADNSENETAEAPTEPDGKEYDSAGNLRKQTYYNPDGSVYSWVEYEYNNAGKYRKTKEYDADGHAIAQSDFDSAGRRTKLTVFYANGRRSCEIEYNGAGKQIKVTYYNWDRSLNSWYEYEYDSAGNCTKSKVFDADGNVSKLYEYEYDSAGNRTKQTEYSPDGTMTYVREYDSAGNRTKTTKYNADGSIQNWYKFEFDDAGNQIKETKYKADGSVNYICEYEYDSAGNRTKTTKYNSDGSVINS